MVVRTLRRLVAVLLAALVSLAAATAAPLDVENLRRIPPLDVARAAMRGDLVRIGLDLNSTSATLARVEAMPAERRNLFWALFLLDGQGANNLHTFMFLKSGDFAPRILVALRELGLAREADRLARALDLFGAPFPVDHVQREKRFAWSAPGRRIDDFTSIPNEPNAFDRALMALGGAAASRRAYVVAVEAAIDARPALAEWIEVEARAALSDDDRLAWLLGELHLRAGERPAETTDAWPAAYRALVLIDIAQLQIMNGGVHQFFLNRSGDAAPAIVTVLRAFGAFPHAQAIERGMALFGAIYPTEQAARREAMKRLAASSPRIEDNWTAWDQDLNAPTDDWDDGLIPQLLLRIAREAGALPR